MLSNWSANRGNPTTGTPWYAASLTPLKPPWERNPFTLGCPRRSFCGNQVVHMTLAGICMGKHGKRKHARQSKFHLQHLQREATADEHGRFCQHILCVTYLLRLQARHLPHHAHAGQATKCCKRETHTRAKHTSWHAHDENRVCMSLQIIYNVRT